jgi:hypothetical protein
VNDWKVIPTIVFTTVLIFGAGVFTGGFLVDYVKQTHPHASVKPHPPQVAQVTNSVPNSAPATNSPPQQPARPVKPPEILSKDFVQRLDTELHLNKDEHDAVQKIVNDGQNEMRKVVQDARLEIREVLTPQQCDEFDSLMKRPFHKPLFGTNTPPVVVPVAAPAAPTNSP